MMKYKKPSRNFITYAMIIIVFLLCELPYVLFGKQTLYGVTSAVFIQTLCSTIALKTSDTQICFQRPFLWCFPSSTL